jgi:hypothetical protein
MPQVKISIKEDLYQKIKTSATNNFRTITEEINYRLHHAYATPTPTHSSVTPTPFTEVTTTTTTAGLSQPVYIKPEPVKYPAVWLKEQNISPTDKSEATFRRFNRAYPKYDYTDFVEIQANRACAYEPDPNDPFDPMANNPYNR